MTTQLLGNRFLTFNSVIRVNQIEIRRDRNAVEDEGDIHKPEHVEALRDAFERGWPGGRMTWGLSWLALHDDRPNYRQMRDLVASYHHRYGDDVTFFAGGFFPNAASTRAEVNRDLHEALAAVSQIVGHGYRPPTVLAGFLAADNLRYLAEQEGVHTCQGNIWSQFGIDNQDGDGSLCYPYYPSREHFCKPAQGPQDFIDCVNLDGWTCDFLAARRAGFTEGFNSRMGCGPIETLGKFDTETALRQLLATTAEHFDAGFALNNFAWVVTCYEVILVSQLGKLDALTRWFTEIRRRWPGAQCPTLAEFGLCWRQQFPTNDPLDYRFTHRGTGIGGSDADKEIRWFMNRDFRLALLRSAVGEHVIDYTRYDLPASEPQEFTRRWSLLGQVNQKQTRTQDKPFPFSQLPAADRDRIRRRYPELAGA